MLSIIYPYRERDLDRIRYSFNSLNNQTNKEFQVYFVDYGSSISHAKKVEELVSEFSFVTYTYLFTEHQPWNKSKALNNIIKQLESGYFFVADIDMIFHPNFIETAIELTKTDEVWYFQVGFLDEKESEQFKDFNAYNVKFKSGREATGLTLCPVYAAKGINGFDEFYHFWGSEDTDFHVRLTNANYKVNYYNNSILMLHQWHKIYRNKEVLSLSKSLQLTGVVQFNQNYLKHVIEQEATIVNRNSWGETLTSKDFETLAIFPENHKKRIELSVVEIDYFLFQTLPSLKGTHYFIFKNEKSTPSFKKTIKGLIKENKNKHYTLKEVNDMVLFHIINFYHNYPYGFLVSSKLDSIHFSIKK